MYTLGEVTELGYRLLDMEPSVVQRYKILKDIIGIERETSEYMEAKNAFYDSEQYLELEAAREDHGMWGQYHTENTKVKRRFKTTEVAMQRCQSLGLDLEDQMIKSLLDSIIGIFTGVLPWPDSMEKTNAWMNIGFRWTLFGGIAKLDRYNPVLDKPWGKVAEMVTGSFRSGEFRQQDHDEIFIRLAVDELTKAQKKRLSTIQFIGTGYWPLMVGATKNKLPYDIEKAYIDWLIDRPDGIYYKSNRSFKSMPDMDSGDFMAFMRVQSLLAPFKAWREGYGKQVHDSFRAASGDDGLWYPGRGAKSLHTLKNYNMHQLADNWRRPEAAKIDFSVFILNFLKKALEE